MSLPPLRSAIPFLTVALLAGSGLQAQPDAPPVDVNQLLKSLETLHGQEAAQTKALKQTAMQQVAAAAGSIERAVALWQEAIKATQMEGAGKEGPTFRAWQEKEGEFYKEREVQSAIHLQLEWLALTLQRSNGATVKEMLPAVINFTKELLGDQAVMEDLDDTIKKDREQPAAMKQRNPRNKEESPEKADRTLKEMHDSILRTAVGNNVVAKWLKVGGYLTIDGWEQTPGNFDGIYINIVQPELRGQLDQHVFDYWDAKLRTEAEKATRSKLTYEIDKFNTLRRPVLLWGRAEEYAYLGQTNRAATEMFNIIKTYPTHPEAEKWIAELQKMVTPPAAGSAAPAAPAPAAAPPAQ